jgi:two-component system LytT family response regulator
MTNDGKKIRAILVDDESLARDRLRSMLSKEGDVEVVAECGDGREALAAIKRETPDVVFLDIQMPEMDGFGVVAHLKGAPPPRVVFVTAYDEFAVKAFEVHALDYLLKPFDRDRLRLAVKRVREELKAGDPAGLADKLVALIDSVRGGKSTAAAGAGTPGTPGVAAVGATDRLVLKLEGRVIFARPGEIDWVEAQDNYVKIHIGREAHLVRDTMASFEAKLDPRRFIRIGRSIIVNIDRVREMQPMFHGEYVVILVDGTKLTMSRGYREAMARVMGEKA